MSHLTYLVREQAQSTEGRRAVSYRLWRRLVLDIIKAAVVVSFAFWQGSCASRDLEVPASTAFETPQIESEVSNPRMVAAAPGSGTVEQVVPVATEAKAAKITQPAEPLTLETLLKVARMRNPTLGQARAQIEAQRGKAVQAGLYPNPVVGYTGEQIGVKGTPGEFQGGFLRQEIVTAGKLRLSSEKYRARAGIAEQLAVAQEYLVTNTVKVHYYQTLGAFRKLEIQRELLKTAEDTFLTVQEMLNVGQANQSELHQVRVLLQDQQLNVEQAENDLQMEWETLMAVVGVQLPPGRLAGELEGDLTPILWERALKRLLTESPEIKAAHAKLEADKITVRREEVEPIPNIVLEGAVGKNYEADETTYAAAVSVEIPLFDRNQGTVQQAKADLMRQQAEVRRTELRLRMGLAEQFRIYQTALQHVRDYKTIVLPESEKRYVTRLQSYRADRETWPAVLEAQHDFFQRRFLYIDLLVAWRRAQVAIEGLLLVDGLQAPTGVTPPGHIDSVPKPR